MEKITNITLEKSFPEDIDTEEFELIFTFDQNEFMNNDVLIKK